MRPALWICIALALTPALALAAKGHAPRPHAPAPPPPPAQAVPKTCGEDCLAGHVDQVLRAMMDHDPSRAPLAADVRYTENGEAKTPGQGLWATASAIAIEDDGLASLGRSSSAYRLYFADPASGQAAYLGAFTEDGRPGMMMLRIKLAAGRVGEIEAVIVRQEPSPPGREAPPAFDPKAFTEPEPTLLAGGERWAPNIMTAAANRYFDGMVWRSSGGIPLGPDCVRRDNGVAAAGTCAAQLDGGAFGRIAEVRRRVLVVDEDRGRVMAMALVNHGPPATDAKAKKKKKKAKGDAAQDAPAPLSTELMGAVFKMSEGKIVRIETLERPVAAGLTSVWGG